MNSSRTDPHSASLVLERLTLKGKGLLDLCLELDKNLCVKGFVDAQLERGEEYLQVVEAMRDHIESELQGHPRGRRKELLVDLRKYIDHALTTLPASEEVEA